MVSFSLRPALVGSFVVLACSAAAAQTYTASVVHDANATVGVVAADLNGDGNNDLVFVEKTAVSVSLNIRHVPFAAPTVVSTHVSGSCGAVGDVNGDGVPDIVTCASGTTLYALIGKGDGTFTDGPTTSLPATPGRFVLNAVIDVNGDGRADVVGSDD